MDINADVVASGVATTPSPRQALLLDVSVEATVVNLWT